MTELHALEKNWAGNYTYLAEKLHRPTTIEQVQEIVANAANVHVLGSRHSFNNIADSQELLSLENLPADVVVDHTAQTVSLKGLPRGGNDNRCTLQAPFRLPPPDGAARPAWRVPQYMAEDACARHKVKRNAIFCIFYSKKPSIAPASDGFLLVERGKGSNVICSTPKS